MAKREAVMLAQTFDPLKHAVMGWYMSTKLDGQRAYWDGGISRGLPVKDVPYANTEKDARFKDPNYKATGLWSRNFKVIHAPEWWLNQLPPMSLDGELYSGLGNFQKTSSVVRTKVSDSDWSDIKYVIFDAPPFETVFMHGTINASFHKKVIDRATQMWVEERGHKLEVIWNPATNYEQTYSNLKRDSIANSVVQVLEQTRLPFGPDAKAMIYESLVAYVKSGGEGLILRKPESYWVPERSHTLLKVKQTNEADARVVGYSWGRRTDKGSRLMGKMGALVVEWNGKVFELSGFTDAERELRANDPSVDVQLLGERSAGERINPASGVINPTFPVGSRVAFMFRELSDEGIPKEGRYLRRKVVE